MSDQERELYLHVGLPKTASSYLQQKVFPRLRGIRYYPKPYFKRFPEVLKRGKATRYLFSKEMLGRLEERTKKIAEDFPDARVIMVLRRQDRWIRSRYKYYLWKSGSLDFREFFDIRADEGYFKQKDLCFKDRIDAIVNHFQHPPLILLQEDLKADPEGWFQRLQEYTGTYLPPHRLPKGPLKVSFGDRQLILLRAFNKRFPYQKPESWPGLFKQTHMNIRQGVNYLIAFLALILPSRYFEDKELIPKEDLEAIREFYKEDWAYCREWAKREKEEGDGA